MPPAGFRSRLQSGFEQGLVASRWLLAPMSVGLALSLVVLLVVFVRKFVGLVMVAFAAGETPTAQIIIGTLSLVDLSLVANLVLMVILASYETFVSRLPPGADGERLTWMGNVGYGDLKLKVIASIVVISAIQVLEVFMDLHDTSDRDLGWNVGIHMSFILSGLLLAFMDRLSKRPG